MKNLIIFLIVLSAISCNNNNSSKNIVTKSSKIESKYFSPISFKNKIIASGIIQSKLELKLSFKTGGIIEKLYVNEGDNVKSGQILAQLKLDEISAKVEQAKLALLKSKRDLSRAQSLYKDSVATLEQFENAKTAYDYANTNLQIANFNLKHSVIYAPCNGKILKIINKENEIIGAGYPVFYFGSKTQNWICKVNISDKDIININIGDSAKIFTDAYPDTFFIGFISEISKMADPYTGTFDCEITIQNKTKKLMTGFIVSTEITSSKNNIAYKIPYSSLIEAENNYGFIYKIDKNKAIKTKVKILKIQDDFLYVFANDLSKYKIITNGINDITDNETLPK